MTVLEEINHLLDYQLRHVVTTKFCLRDLNQTNEQLRHFNE
jgi:hypothetical protein